MKHRFDPGRAERAEGFFERLLVHTKGSWARKPFALEPFQREIIRSLFGELVLDPDTEEWVRRYTLAWLEMGRGNGKSELMAGIALLLTGADDEESAEVYGVARDIDQASLVFNVARRMVELSSLSKHFKVYPRYREIVYPKTASRYKVVPGDALGNLGQDPHGILFDEVITQPNGELWDALKTGFKRAQPLMVAATTAGDQPDSFAKAEHDFALRVADDPKLAPRRFVFVRSVPTDAEPGDEKSWAKGNPALGLFLRPQILRDEWTEAQGHPRALKAFRQFRLNQWQDAPAEAWLDVPTWDQGLQMVDEAKLEGRTVWGGLVATTTKDLTALAWVFPPGDRWEAIWRFFLPEEVLPDLMARTNGDAQRWVDEGRLTLTEGDQIDVAAHVEAIEEGLRRFAVQELVHEKNVVLGIIQPVMSEHPKIPVGIGYRTPGGALLDWEALLQSGEFAHGGNPICRWEVGHALAKESADGTLRLDRKHSSDDISGIAACELALRRALVVGMPRPSVYETRGPIVV